jgi:asparagine synthase (glutamine-hydrolysing)
MLAAFDQWGITKSLHRFNGMFGFAVWDRRERTLTLARDRFGEKPLYYAIAGKTLLFASELKAFHAHPAFQASLDLNAVALYMRHNCIPAPYSIYSNTYKLPPATTLAISDGNFDSTPRPYWSLHEVIEDASQDRFHGTEQDAIESLDRLLRDAVKIRMYSDVPVGAFLSGGIDSSTIVGLMQAQSNVPIKTFSIGQEENGYNEAAEAAAVARHLCTDHTELYATPAQTLAIIPRLPAMYDEPFADSSQIPTFLVAELARAKVTVSLSGDGGDEIFGGYNRHTWGASLWNQLSQIPRPLRGLGAFGMSALSPQVWDSLFETFKPLLPRVWRQRTPGYKLHKMASVMSSRDVQEMYYRFVSHWSDPQEIVRGASERSTLLTNRNFPSELSAAEQMMYLDSMTYLPDDILVKIDRATMAVSLEGRVPFLDHRITEFAWRLPLSMRIRGREGKWILRQVLYRYVPRELVERPKFGFGVPLGTWLRGPLREWAEELLSEARLVRDQIFNPKPIRRAWLEHLSGRRDLAFHLWDVLLFQAWLEEHQRPSGLRPIYDSAMTSVL